MSGDTYKQPGALEHRDEAEDARLFSPSAARNRDVIADAFEAYMPLQGRILEIASGTGEHAVHILSRCPKLRWIASELDGDSQKSIVSWIKHAGLEAQFEGLITLDAASLEWGIEGTLDGMMVSNMLHISPWLAGQGVFRGAGRYLKSGGRLFIYGPFKRNGDHTAQSNMDFDENLRTRNVEWGIRDVELELIPAAQKQGLELKFERAMPANNFSLVFEKC